MKRQARLSTGLGLAVAGFVIAVFAAICGIGGGLFVTPILHYGFKFDLRRSVATALALVAATTSSATVTESLHADGAINWFVVAAMLAGGLVGAELGFRLGKKLSARKLKFVFVFVLIGVAIRIFTVKTGSGGDVSGPLELDAVRLFIVALIGMAAAFTAPLLGIGGGMISVPALFLGLPEIGYLGARACAMALGSVASLRSLWLYNREGLVQVQQAVWLGGGALIGAAVGVNLIHIEGADQWGQRLLASFLLLVAVRFAFDLRRPDSGESSEEVSKAEGEGDSE